MKLTDAWYDAKAKWPLVLKPLELIYTALAAFDKSKKLKNQWQPPCPLIIVGNISVGGTGKSPLTIALIDLLQDRGYRVGVVSRGYKSSLDKYPYQVKASDPSEWVGDEPSMIVKRTGVNLVVDPNRVSACQYLLANNDCDVIISDDGLQHYSMGRDIEICVIDSARGLGNGHSLPVGPLRESPKRLKQVDFIVFNGDKTQCNNAAYQSLAVTEKLAASFTMQLAPLSWQQVSGESTLNFQQMRQFVDQNQYSVSAFAGIGHPQRFFNTLDKLGINADVKSYPDHYHYSKDDFSGAGDNQVLLMTEKDAVKCQNYVPAQSYYLKIGAQLEAQFIDQLLAKLSTISKG